MQSRISRGFSRLALLVAVPLLGLAAVSAGTEWKWQVDTDGGADAALLAVAAETPVFATW